MFRIISRPIIRRAPRLTVSAVALSLGLALSACGGKPINRSVESIHQPVVERTNYTLDVTTGSGGLSYPEQRRLSGWLEAMNLRYGDRVSIDDPLKSAATRSAVEAVIAPHGMLLSDDAPVTGGFVSAGTARIIITRARASVPGCPNWSTKTDTNLINGTSSNYGCAVNSNLAAMVANPEHLVRGETGGSDTVVMSSNKAISTYRDKAPTGAKDLKAAETSGGK